MSRRVDPTEAKRLMDEEGYTYLDVRSVPEFEAGHPTGAFNVPLLHATAAGMSPNPDFVAVVEKAFPKDARLVVGCQSGGRSARAVAMLEASGFTNLVDQQSGFGGTPLAPGWRRCGLPTSARPEPDRTWEALRSKAGR